MKVRNLPWRNRVVLFATFSQRCRGDRVCPMDGFSVSVNVSVRQFRQPDFVQQVLDTVEQTGVNPHKLKLELTESMLVDNFDDTITKMTTLKSIGVGFSLDDFGTGYSSLSYLKRLPLDQLIRASNDSREF